MVAKRASFELRKASKRLHLVDGFLSAMSSMDAVVNCIRAAKDGETAMQELQSTFALTKEQAEGVMSLTLRRLTSMENKKLEEEQGTLRARCVPFLQPKIRSDSAELNSYYYFAMCVQDQRFG